MTRRLDIFHAVLGYLPSADLAPPVRRQLQRSGEVHVS